MLVASMEHIWNILYTQKKIVGAFPPFLFSLSSEHGVYNKFA